MAAAIKSQSRDLSTHLSGEMSKLWATRGECTALSREGLYGIFLGGNLVPKHPSDTVQPVLIISASHEGLCKTIQTSHHFFQRVSM